MILRDNCSGELREVKTDTHAQEGENESERGIKRVRRALWCSSTCGATHL